MNSLIMITGVLLTLFCSCQNTKPDIEKEKRNVLNTDIEFSNFSEKYGMIKAFLEFSDQDAVLLRSHSMPIEGKANIGKSLTAINDTLFTLTWKPLHITISESADLAYSYGTFSSVVNDTLRTEGTYLTIWKKQDDLSWKWILDTGNEGLD